MTTANLNNESSSKVEDLVKRLGKPQPLLIGLGIILAIIVDILAFHYGGTQLGVQLWLGVALGLALFHSRFGFTSAFRRFLAVGNGEGIRAQMVMLAVASTLFAIILGTGFSFFGGTPSASVSPIGVSLVVGAFLFGIGMQMGEGCASGTLYHIGGGKSENYLTIVGFVAGSALGAYHWNFWVNDLPSFKPFSFATSTGLGYFGGWVIQMIIFAAVFFITLVVEKKRQAPKMAPIPTSKGWARILRGSWPVMIGAIVLAVLNAITLAVRNSPWGVTSAFALWGSKIANGIGFHPESWVYWQGEKGAVLHQSIFADSTSILNFGVIIGAFIAATLGGLFFFTKLPVKLMLSALIGGILMGYGARLAFGCNIGAYFSGIASFSLHGWVWLIFAMAGSFTALYIRPLFGMKVPSSDDRFC
ncbi:putative membrane protein YedE/YeeE [Pullulanibacillus pueri]|uniref:Membrane protein n=1 Tax=Pullulanibacillus pueri TaxID=1437324 RepID=A0A8J2ZWU8_9BACL|nr:YeeE/YedE family protein [Pullulanibacillus pueri]MBM7682408.1 putative membrane protein YedE/YeeE [Pullulanibacillus pueri]GGH81753.1 membrane protein [Pullulanibacillus pueri]